MFTHRPAFDLGYIDLVCETLESGRTYVTPAGKKYPSITTVLGILSSEDIQNWKNRVGLAEANNVSRRAAGRGTRVHELVERYLNNENLTSKGHMPDAWSAFNSIKKVLSDNVSDIILQERPLYSDHLGVAGRVDLVAKWNGRNSIIDIKTSGHVKSRDAIHAYFMQEAGYAVMVEERTKIPVDQIVTVMTVDFHEPLIFIEKRDDWIGKLQDTIKLYHQSKSV